MQKVQTAKLEHSVRSLIFLIANNETCQFFSSSTSICAMMLRTASIISFSLYSNSKSMLRCEKHQLRWVLCVCAEEYIYQIPFRFIYFIATCVCLTLSFRIERLNYCFYWKSFDRVEVQDAEMVKRHTESSVNIMWTREKQCADAEEFGWSSIQ